MNKTYFQVPAHCPECSAELTMQGEYLVCPNEDTCPAQVAGSIKAWVSKIGLKGVGTSLIDTLCEQGIINDAADLYTLDAGELADVRMDGRRVGGTADIVYNELHAKKELPLHVFVGSLNINLCSRSTMKTIVDAGYDTIDKMKNASLGEIASIPGMGTGRAQSFVDGMISKAALMDKLLANGITIQAPADGKFKGQTFCFTGVRDDTLEAVIEGMGGTIKSGVSRKLTVLIAKTKTSSSGKMKKARQYGAEILDLEEMWERAGGRP